MRRFVTLLFALAIPIAVSADDDVKKELKVLEGKWKVSAIEANGSAFPKEQTPDFTFIVGADGKCTAQSPQGEFQVNIKLNPKANPKAIDNEHQTGPHQGMKQFGIYKLDGDKWLVCAAQAGGEEKDRPKSFTTKDSGNVLFTFERVKEKK